MPSNLPVKPIVRVGSDKVVILDRTIVRRLRITEGNTYVQQELTPEGILLRIKRYQL